MLRFESCNTRAGSLRGWQTSKRYNVWVHRARTNIQPLHTRPIECSACNPLLSPTAIMIQPSIVPLGSSSCDALFECVPNPIVTVVITHCKQNVFPQRLRAWSESVRACLHRCSSVSAAQPEHRRVCPYGNDRASARVSVGITSGFTGHERTSNHFTPARLSAPCATLCYTAIP